MPTVEEVIQEVVPQVKVMQLATSVDDQPWACNLHFYSDDELNLYWLSTEARQHSQEIAHNPKVAATVLVHLNTPEEDYVIGVSFAGTAEYLGGQAEEAIRNGYQGKHNTSNEFLSAIAAGTNPHKWYQLKPTEIVLFDTKHFPDNPRRELKISV